MAWKCASEEQLQQALSELGGAFHSKIATRSLRKALVKLGKINDDVVVLDADLSKSKKQMIL